MEAVFLIQKMAQCYFCHILLVEAVIESAQIQGEGTYHLPVGALSENLWPSSICCNDGLVSLSLTELHTAC